MRKDQVKIPAIAAKINENLQLPSGINEEFKKLKPDLVTNADSVVVLKQGANFLFQCITNGKAETYDSTGKKFGANTIALVDASKAKIPTLAGSNLDQFKDKCQENIKAADQQLKTAKTIAGPVVATLSINIGMSG